MKCKPKGLAKPVTSKCPEGGNPKIFQSHSSYYMRINGTLTNQR